MDTFELRVLGPVEAVRDGRQVDLGRPQQRAVLGILAVRWGTVVPVETLIDALWPNDPPSSAEKVVQTHVSRLRKALGEEATIERRGGGYLLRVPSESLDLFRFEELQSEGRLAEALALWRGPALADVASVPGMRADADRLDELRLCAWEERFEREIAAGRAAEMVPDLRRLVTAYPLRERLRGLLMRALYRAGRQAEALAAYREAHRLLVGELGIEPGSELRQLEKRILAQDATLGPPERARHGSALPVPATPFLGRQRELEEVIALISDEDVRLLTLTGSGGIGKTRLALQAAAAIEGRFPRGVVWAALASLREPALLLVTIARAADVGDQPGESVANALADALGGSRTLLVLDNAEHLLPAAADEIATLRAAGICLLVTSRERLRLSGERVYRVPPLRREDALSLFVTRSAAAGGDADFSPQTSELCRRLDDLPLALELAAARTVILSPRQLLDRLDQRLDLLKGARDTDPRQATMRATIEWSYDLLGVGEQQLFRRLSVFAGGCTLEAAEEVCDANIETLQSLVEKNLLSSSCERFAMLETIRTFALEVNDRYGENVSLRLRHARYFLAFAQKTQARVSAPDRQRWVDARAAELDNLREAFAWSLESGETRLAQELALAFGGAAFVHTSELRVRLGHVLDTAADLDPVLRARVLKLDGYAALVTGDYDAARARLSETLAVLRDTAPEAELADVLAGLGEVERITGHFDVAQELFTEAAGIAARSGAKQVWNMAIFSLARVEFDQQNYALAREVLSRLDVERFIWPLVALGLMSLAEGELDDAARYFRRCVERAHEEAARRRLAYGLAGLAVVAARRRHNQRAGRLWGAVEMLNKLVQPGLMPHDEPTYRTQLDDLWNDPTFAAARAEGQALSVEEAAALGLEIPGRFALP